MISKTYYDRYVQILKEELIPAMGCTEPIAIAYASAIAAKHLGVRPDAVQVEVSGNIIKNAKSVVVPNTGGLRGIPAAAAAGIVAGDPSRELKVIAQASLQDIERIRQFLRDVPITVSQANTGNIFDIRVTVFNGTQSSSVHICDFHTNVREIRKNGDIVFTRDITAMTDSLIANRSFMNVADIIEFADTVRIADVQEILDKQIEYNTAISEEGLQGDYGANIGRVLLRTYGDTDVKIRARAKAAAASDARMDGCELPVVVNSGSGNQGIAASVPVIEYAAELGASRELLYRALIVSNLTTIHMKTGIGRLSAYCGAVSAGCGSGAGIAYLHGGKYEEIAHTIVNALAITSGMVCDGAKASCAAKIATAVDAGILGYHMYKNGQQFWGGDGIVTKGVENTIVNIGQLARNGMSETDKEILRIMTRC